LVASAAKLCEAEKGVIFLRQGDHFCVASNFGFSPEFEAFAKEHPLPVGGASTTARAAASGRSVQAADILSDGTQSELALQYQRLGGHRTNLGVPLRRDGETIGVFTLTRQVVQPFTKRQIELVEIFADQAVIAIENARLFEEVQAKTRDLEESLQQQMATADVLKIISRSAFDLHSVFNTVARSALELCAATGCALFLREGEALSARGVWGVEEEFAKLLRDHPVQINMESHMGRVLLTGGVANIADFARSDTELRKFYDFRPFNSFLAVPLTREDQNIGVFTIYRDEGGGFTERQVELVKTFADQAAIAIENARLFEEVQARTRELAQSLDDLRAAQDRLIQTEKLASLGQLTAGIAHEIKNPLNFVNNFSALSAELIDELDETLAPAPLDQKMRGDVGELTQMLKSNLEKVVLHGKRADSIVKNMLQHSREGSGEHRPTDINAIVGESLNLAYHGARAEKAGFSIALQRDLDPSAGMADIYPQEITRVLLNLISNGFYATTKRKTEVGDGFEPILSATTKNLGDKVEICIRDNGSGIPEEVKTKIFNPFFTTKPSGEGTGLGLSMSHDIIVKQHGGSIDVETRSGLFTEFKIVLPRTTKR
jgi:two-component system, NtrC family, sensor kinase